MNCTKPGQPVRILLYCIRNKTVYGINIMRCDRHRMDAGVADTCFLFRFKQFPDSTFPAHRHMIEFSDTAGCLSCDGIRKNMCMDICNLHFPFVSFWVALFRNIPVLDFLHRTAFIQVILQLMPCAVYPDPVSDGIILCQVFTV